MTYISRQDDLIQHAIDVIENTYSDLVSVKDKSKDLVKFGFNPSVGSSGRYTIWGTGVDRANETYVSRNLIDSISSSSASDTGQVVIEGHTVGSDILNLTLTQSAGVATGTTISAHGFSVDEWVYIEGATPTAYNGIVKVLSVPTTTTFTYSVPSGTSSPAVGVITATSQNKTFVTQTLTLNGRTRVALSTALARATRVYVPEQNNATDLAGAVYVYQNTALTAGKPTDTSKIHISTTAGENFSRKASTTLSNTDYWIVTNFSGGFLQKSGSNVVDVRLEVRTLGGVFRMVSAPVVMVTGENQVRRFDPYLIIPKNADVRLTANASANNQGVNGDIQGFLASIQ